MNYNFETLTTWIMAAFGVALVTTIVIHPQSAKVITSFGNALSNSIRASIGK